MNANLSQGWASIIERELNQDYGVKLREFVEVAYESSTVYPPKAQIFAAFETTPFEDVRVVILGQDPYHGPNQANGLSFSVNEGIKFPPSLRNIFTELKDDVGIEIPTSGDLSDWAKQGVLLLNATLTVEAGKAGSHQKKGWEIFTDAVIRELAEKREHIVFILWGSYAQKKGKSIDRTKHLVIETAHPSPLSVYRGFWGSRPFSKTNEYLQSKQISPINW